jgi:hypothetical protein
MSPGRWPKYAVCTRQRLPCEDRSTASGPAAGASAATCRRHQSANPQRPGSSRAWAASTAQSAHSSLGLGFCRHSTAISWHNTSSSASLMLPSVQAAPSSRLDAGTPDRSSVPSRTSDPARHGCSPPANQQVSRFAPYWNPTAALAAGDGWRGRLRWQSPGGVRASRPWRFSRRARVRTARGRVAQRANELKGGHHGTQQQRDAAARGPGAFDRRTCQAAV